MTQLYNTKFLLSGYPVYIGYHVFTDMMRNHTGQKKASTAWSFSDQTGNPAGVFVVPDQDFEIHPNGDFAAFVQIGPEQTSYYFPRIIKVCEVDTLPNGEMGEAKQLDREALIARIPKIRSALSMDYDGHDPKPENIPERFIAQWKQEIKDLGIQDPLSVYQPTTDERFKRSG